jgi:MoxR-like ATPase
LEQDQSTGERRFRFVEGPLFGNVILADEINRTPPKTQSALLEAMEERQISVGGRTYKLPQPFFVLATMNPIEQEGTYPLPEAQQDRFMLKVVLDYPTEAQEMEIVRRASGPPLAQPAPIIDAAHLIGLQQLVQRVPTADHVVKAATSLVRSTRTRGDGVSDFAKEMIAWGAGPRASICLVQAAKARALLQGRHHATEEDVMALAQPVLRHRIMPTFNAEADGYTTDHIIGQLMAQLKSKK